MAGVRAVDHVVGDPVTAGRVDLLDRLPHPLAARQPAVRLDREREHQRHGQRPSRPGQAERLLHVPERGGHDQVHRHGGEGGELRAVVRGGLVDAHAHGGRVGVRSGPDAAGDEDRHRARLERGADAHEQLELLVVQRLELARVVAEAGAPVGTGAPGGGLEDHPHPFAHPQLGERAVVALEERPSARSPHQVEGSEVRERHPFVVDEPRLETAFGQQKRPWIHAPLWPFGAVLGNRRVRRRRDARVRAAPMTQVAGAIHVWRGQIEGPARIRVGDRGVRRPPPAPARTWAHSGCRGTAPGSPGTPPR